MEGLITMDIIIADDQVNERSFARRVISSYLLNPIFEAGNAGEALAAVFPPRSTEARVPQLVVASLDLPPSGGLELVRALRCDSRTAAVPVVLVASSPEECDRLRGRLLPRTVCVAKPLNLAALSEALRLTGICWVLTDSPMAVPPPALTPILREMMVPAAG